MYYFDVLGSMEENKIKYLVVGGLAVNLYNVQRLTNDIDFIISMDKDNIIKFVHAMKGMGYVPRVPVNPELLADKNTVNDWVNNKNMKAFSFYNEKRTFEAVDIVIVQPLDFNKAYENRVIKKINNIDVSVVSLEDLTTMKETSGRVKDLEDVKKLNEVKIMKEEKNIDSGVGFGL